MNYNVILSLDFMHNTQAYIDFSTNTLSICDGLVFENVISNSTPTNAIYPKSKCVIPPSSEAIIPVHSKDSVDGLHVCLLYTSDAADE